MMHKRLDELSRGSSQERITDPYQTMPVNHRELQPSTKDSQHLLDKSSIIDKSLMDKSLTGEQSHGGRSSYRGESREANHTSH